MFRCVVSRPLPAFRLRGGSFLLRSRAYAGAGWRVQCLVALSPAGKIWIAQPVRGNSARHRACRGGFQPPFTRSSRGQRCGSAQRPAPATPGGWLRAKRGWPAGTPVDGGQERRAQFGSLQERALKVELIIGTGAVALGKEAAQMFDRLEERIGLRTGRGWLLPAKPRAHCRQAPSQPVQQMVKGLQRKRQRQRLDCCFDGTTGQQANEQPPQPWPRHRMARQYIGQEDGKTPPTAAPSAPVAAPHPLAPLPLGFPVAGARVVAVELAMAV